MTVTDWAACDTCGDAYAGYDPEDAGLYLCANSVPWNPGPWHCDTCIACGECGPCRDASARERQAEHGIRSGRRV